MTADEFQHRLAALEREVHYLVQLVDNLYQQAGLVVPVLRAPGSAPAPQVAGSAAAPQPGPGSHAAGPTPVPPDPALRAALADGDLIGAIKRYRELTGVGLREAKDAVESMTGRN